MAAKRAKLTKVQESKENTTNVTLEGVRSNRIS